MKKYFLSIVALAGMLFATSCQESLVEPQVDGTTTFSIEVPGQMGTKAIGDASIIDRLYVAVYENFDENGGTLPTSAIYKTNVPVSGGVATVALNLIQGQKYDIVFWAQNENENSYVDADDELLSIPMKNTFHNNEQGAAFFHFERNFEPKGSAKKIELRRPFAQLNLGTTEESLETDLGDVTLIKSKVVVSSVATSFNTVTGEGVAETTTSATYEANIVFDQCLTVSGKDYVYISMDYLPIVGDNQALVTVAAEIKLENGQVISHEFTNVPVKENYRTNIVGNLISSTTDFNVVVDAEFDGELPESGKEQLQFVAANGGEVILQENVVLDEPLVITAGTKATLVPVVIDLNGKSISYTSDVAAHSAMITLNGGSLTVKDSQGNGKISYTYTGVGDPNFGWGTYTIANYGGTLVVDNGTIEMNCALNPGNGNPNVHMYCAVYQYNGSTTINGGTIKNDTYRSARLWQGDMNILGGSFIGQLWVQAVNNSAKLNITGGQFAPTGNDGSSVFVTNNTYEVSLNVAGGTFETKLGCSDFTKAGVKGSVYGGIFVEEQPNENLIADEYKVIEKDGRFYVVAEDVEPESVVTNAKELKESLESGKEVMMICDIVVPNNEEIVITNGKESSLDMNGYTISSTNTRSETHNNFFLVKGTLNIENGTITYEHTGNNMGWNGCTNLVNITAGGILNLNDVVLNNLGGTDMNFAVHMNNWGEVTLNADNCQFLSTYCGVRVFNSGFDMNNVTIRNSKLIGNTRAFWVHNYIGDLNSAQHTDDAIKNRLNFSLYNNNNTFEISGEAVSPIRYGFSNPMYYIISGNEIYTQTNNEAKLVSYSGTESNVVLPDGINGTPITAIGRVFDEKPITSVILPSQLEVIGNRAFRKCLSLETISLPSTVIEFEEGAFQGAGLKEIEIPENVTYLAKQSIGYCPNLETIVIKATEITIATYLARACPSLKEVYIYSEKIEFESGGSMYFTNRENGDASGITFYVRTSEIAETLYNALSVSHSYGLKIVSIDGDTVYYNTLK